MSGSVFEITWGKFVFSVQCGLNTDRNFSNYFLKTYKEICNKYYNIDSGKNSWKIYN